MEELFHAYQSNVIPGGIEQYIGKAGISNIEFEAGLIHDMMELVEPSGYRPVYFGMPEQSMFFKSYQTWLDKITNYGTTYPRSIDLPAYLEQVRSFRSANSTHPFYGTGYSETMKPETMLNLTNGSNCK